MNQGGGQKQLKLSSQQIDILLWLAKQEGRVRPKSPPVKQAKRDAYPRHLQGVMAEVERINECIEANRRLLAPYEWANEVKERYERLNEIAERYGVRVADSPPAQEPDPEPQRPEPKPVRLGTRWSPEIYLGRTPTDSERVMLSNRLASLERQGLIKRTRNRGKRKRTTHLKLTRKGIEVVNELLAVNNSQAAELPINNS